MKTMLRPWVARGFTICILATACNPQGRQDSAEIAKKENDDNFEKGDQENDADFIVDAVAENYAEIRFAQLAINRSANLEIKEIARIMEKDHAEGLVELKGFAAKKGITIPLEETEDARKKVSKIAGNARPEFDKAWCSELVRNRQKRIRTYELMWEKTEDPDLKQWINHTLPNLRNHLVKLTACHERITSL